MQTRILTLVALSCMLCACVSETNRVEPVAQQRDGDGLPHEVQRIPQQMQKLSGELLRYHALNQQLPASLQDLVKAEIMTATDLAELPDYLYVPAGQCVLPDGRVLVLVDSKPRIEGHAWCIVRETNAPPRSILLNVTPISIIELDAATR